jgi:hypothetical protein
VSDLIDCPNCDSQMPEGEDCPECDHYDDKGCCCDHCASGGMAPEFRRRARERREVSLEDDRGL